MLLIRLFGNFLKQKLLMTYQDGHFKNMLIPKSIPAGQENF